MAFHTELVHAAAVDRQVQTMQTPSPLWLPRESAPGEAEPQVAPDDRGAGAAKPTPTAMIPPTAPTAMLPRVAPTARIAATAQLADGARLAPSSEVSTTTLRAAAGSYAIAGTHQAPRRRWLVVGAGIALALVAGVGYWQLHDGREPAPLVSEAPPSVPARPSPPEVARVLVENAPPGLRVSVDGEARDLPVVLPFGSDIHTLLFEAPGYHPTEFHVDGSRASRSLVLAMKPLAAGDNAAPANEEDATSKKGRPHAKRHRKQSDILTAR
jgi:hypothetical protein